MMAPRKKIVRTASVATATCALSAGLAFGAATPAQAALPWFLPTPTKNVLVVGGTDDPKAKDMLARTEGWFGSITPKPVETPATFGIGKDGVLVIPIIKGDGSGLTYDGSSSIGAANVVDALGQTEGPVTVVTISQGSRAAYDAIYVANRDGVKSGDEMTGVLLAFPRHKNTGIETVLPSFIPGLHTNGPIDPAATGDSTLFVICVAGDPVCGLNPYSPSSYFYAIPGFLQIHSKEYGNIDQMEVIRTDQDGNVTYIALDPGFNPWGQLLRSYDLPVSSKFDEILTKLVPLDTPGAPPTIAGQPVKSPRELQEALYGLLGLKMPVTAPDQIDAQNPASTIPALAARSVTVPSAVATGEAAPEPQVVEPLAEQPVPEPFDEVATVPVVEDVKPAPVEVLIADDTPVSTQVSVEHDDSSPVSTDSSPVNEAPLSVESTSVTSVNSSSDKEKVPSASSSSLSSSSDEPSGTSSVSRSLSSTSSEDETAA